MTPDGRGLGVVRIAPGEREARQFALIALAILVSDRLIISLLFVMQDRTPVLRQIYAVPLAAFVFSWVLPFVIVYRVEGRDARSLGMSVGEGKGPLYILYAVACLALPALFVPVDTTLLSEFVEQIVYIGVAEELFSRGYLMKRLCDWLGDWRGLLLNALIFGLSHVFSRLAQHGLQYPDRLATVFAQTFAGGLMLGYVYHRARSIMPGAILHTGMNAYLPRLIDMVSR